MLAERNVESTFAVNFIVGAFSKKFALIAMFFAASIQFDTVCFPAGIQQKVFYCTTP